ncbi:MAG: DUF559 domain-containing protein [Candidatus Cloacimonetes bacterium]|nr:DUF559 domain-containing protein [Candidatus Cloacimonadota bacterium]
MIFVKGHIPWNKNKKRPPFSKEWKRNMSISHKGQKAWNKDIKMSEEFKQKLRKPKSEEHKRNLSISHKGRSVWITGLTKETDERVKNLSNSLTGIKRSEQTRKNISKSKKGKKNPNFGKPRSEETKQKIRDSNKGKHYHSEKSKKNLREKALLRMRNKKGPFKDTKPELKMKEILNFLNIPFEHQFRLDNYLYDFHILNTNILIEVDGDYFHGNPKKFSKLNKMQLEMKERDLKHNKIAKVNNFVLLRFWQDDILNNEKIVVNKLEEFINGS